GYAPQVNAREINLFYLLPGKRERIVFIENEFRVLNTDLKFSSAEMESELEQFPERFSPNVLMRPLYQETVLPNIAYIGGPAEVSYWLQCRSNFEGFGIEYPVVLLRDMALLLKPAQRRTLDKAMLPTNRLFASREQWIQWVAKELTNVDIESEKKRVAEGFERMAAKFSAVDPTLEGAVNGEKQRVFNAIDQLEKKLVRAVKQKSETVLAKIGDLHDALFPRGEWQERVKNYFEVSMWAGSNLVEELIPLFDPTEAVCRVLTPQPTAKDAKPETTAE
ncbi:MAG: bacillithiol biosynthesis BshC, partial [Flavobacteriales bacterium]|nr:bacillithiol biosynthesis BshC [Flavobacteriales bacterium]